MVSIGAVIQARVSSTRLPRKILEELPFKGHITVLEQVIKRLKQAKKLDEIIVATTIEKEDDEIVNIVKKEDVKYFRGDKEDVLARYYLAARENSLDVIVRITSDCPCVDPEIIDSFIDKFISSDVDYLTNTINRTYPHGLDVEIFNFDSLQKAFKKSTKDHEKEHVTIYIKRRPDCFRIMNVDAPEENRRPQIRVTLDTYKDYMSLCAVFDYLYYQNPYFKVKDLVGLFDQKPWLYLINSSVRHKKICESWEEKIKEAITVLEFQGLEEAKEILCAELRKNKK